MSDGSKRLYLDGKASLRPGMTYEFLPEAPLPPNLPPAPVAIAEMANAFGVTHRTLHFYEEKGLITAGRIGLMRVYDRQDVIKMAVINACREVGMPVAVVQEMMEELRLAKSQDDADRIFHEALMIRKRELIAGLSTVHRQMQQIGILLDGDTAQPASPINDNSGEFNLSGTEKKCLELMAEGYPATRIAALLRMTEKEAQALETDIIGKFNSNNRFQAVARAVLLGIVHF